MITYKQFLNEEGLMQTNFETYTGPEDAFNHVKKFGYRIADAEEVIKTDPVWAYKYAEEIVRSRWPEAEDVMKTNTDIWSQYIKFLNGLRRMEDK